MDAFEAIVASMLERAGYWVRVSFKVELTKAEKVSIGRPSCPRWEIDLLAYKAATNELLLVECKSYLDSRGVQSEASGAPLPAKRYKLFTDDSLYLIVVDRLVSQLTAAGSICPNPKVTLCLAAAKFASARDRQRMHGYFAQKGWTLWDDTWLADSLERAATSGYDNHVASVAAKLLLRKVEPLAT